MHKIGSIIAVIIPLEGTERTSMGTIICELHVTSVGTRHKLIIPVPAQHTTPEAQQKQMDKGKIGPGKVHIHTYVH